jgi:putative ABC transport system ATP-binding protein
MKNIIEVINLSKYYDSNGKSLKVLENINLSIGEGETISIIGPSGSGKTTLLGLCAGLDQPTHGEVIINGKNISTLSEDMKAELRSQEIGFIFQNFQLLPTLSALENVMIPMELKAMKGIKERALDLLSRVGLKDRSHHYPSQLSGGEQQRVSLARAFGNNPSILFADEPTGNLDGDTSIQIESLMFDLNKENNTTLIIVTHNYELAEKTQRVISMKNGSIISDKHNK